MDVTTINSRLLAEEMNREMTSVVLPVTAIAGIEVFLAFFGNLLVLYVFSFKYHRCNFKYFVLCLSVIDTTASVTTLPGEIVTQTHWNIYPARILCKIKSFFNVFNVTASALCLLVIAVDRYLKVCRPFGWQIKTRKAILLCPVIIVLSILISFPVAIFWGTHDDTRVYRAGNASITICEIDRDFVHTKGPLIYIVMVSVVIVHALIAMTVLYVLIVKTLINKTTQKPTAVSAERSNSRAKELLDVPNTLHAATNEAFVDPTSDEPPSRGNTPEGISPTSIQTDGRGTTTTIPPLARRTTIQERNVIVRQKTKIMLVLTVVFVVTTIVYLSLAAVIATDVLAGMSNGEKSAYFFFFRLNFINHVVNPWVYGLLDPHFRAVIKEFKHTMVALCFARCKRHDSLRRNS